MEPSKKCSACFVFGMLTPKQTRDCVLIKETRACPRCRCANVLSADRRTHSRGLKNKTTTHLVNLWACNRVFRLSASKKRRVDYSHASRSKVVGLHVLIVKNAAFRPCVRCFSPLPPHHSRSEASGLQRLPVVRRQGAHSRVFEFISTRINRLSRPFKDRDQVQLLARSRLLLDMSIFPK